MSEDLTTKKRNPMFDEIARKINEGRECDNCKGLGWTEQEKDGCTLCRGTGNRERKFEREQN